MRFHIESGHNFVLAKKKRKTTTTNNSSLQYSRESLPAKTNNLPHVLMSGEIDIATKCVGMEEES